MNLRPIGIVYRKELRDLLRDFRTIMSMIIVPVLIVPIIILGVLKAAEAAMKEKPSIMLLGEGNSPECVAALKRMNKFIMVPESGDYTNLIVRKKIRAAVEIPKDFDTAVDSERKTAIRIYNYASEPSSMQAAQQLWEFFSHRREEIVRRRLLDHSLAESFVTPFDIQKTNVASPRQITGVIMGMIMPYLMIVMCLAGAIYPSVDLTAGEKERGTLETLLTSPVPRTHLALGKVLVVLTTSLATALLSLSSNGLELYWIDANNIVQMPLALDPMALAGACLMMIPLAVFISSMTVAAGLFARSSKEANTYMQPGMLLAIIPAVASALPGVEFNSRVAFIPIINISLLCKELLAGTFQWGHVLLVFGTMSFYAALAVAATVALFKRESVLFRT